MISQTNDPITPMLKKLSDLPNQFPQWERELNADPSLRALALQLDQGPMKGPLSPAQRAAIAVDEALKLKRLELEARAIIEAKIKAHLRI